jgi:homogentisate 1,2-dioxygenase
MSKLQRNYDDLKYQPGFGNDHVTEALPDAIPKNQNSPQRCPYGLYNEQLSGTPFTKPRAQNLRTWLYRIMPSPHRGEYKPVDYNPNVIGDFTSSQDVVITPERKRFNPMEFPKEDTNFVQGLFTICGAGTPELHHGLNYQIFACNKSMTNIAYVNCDGDYLVFPTEGTLYIVTEFGKLTCSPHEFVVLPRAIKFSVEVTGPTRGYCFETYKGHFKLPELGQMGANGLASPRHFEAPVAYYEDSTEEYTLICKFIGKFHECKLDHSPFDVVAWWGNYYPFRYNLDLYNLYSTVTWDHPDASLYSVLQVPSDEVGMHIADIQLFPPRWWVAEHTLRPNYFHRNHQNEIVGKLWDDKSVLFPFYFLTIIFNRPLLTTPMKDSNPAL